MAKERERPSVNQRLSGQGLVDTLRREKALSRKAKKRDAMPPPGDPRPIENPPAVPAPEGNAIEQSPGDLASRLYRAFAGQMDQLEAHLKDLFAETGQAGTAGAGDLQEIDKTVKTLASLAKTLSALMELKSDTEPDGENNSLDDREELRADLARRLERLCGQPKD